MAAIENYHGKTSLGTAILTALLSGDVDAAEEGLNRMSQSELNMLGEICEDLAERAYGKVAR